MAISGKVLALIVVIIFLAVYVAGVSLATGVDTKAPMVLIKSPTQESEYVTSASSVIVAGSAYDEVGVKGVSWKNNATGESGNCSGSTDMTSWTSGLIDLKEGRNRIDVKVWDKAGNIEYASIKIFLDETKPTCTITNPTTNPTYKTYANNISLIGRANDGGLWYDGIGVVSIEYINLNNTVAGAGALGPNGAWSISKVSLGFGDNVIVVKSKDAAGNYGEDRITVTRLM